MTTRLEKTLRRQITVKGQEYIVALSPDGLKITLKGKRKGLELSWNDLVSGEAALAVALNASVGRFAEQPNARPARDRPARPARDRPARSPRDRSARPPRDRSR